MRRAGKGEEVCRRKTGVKNVGVCRFGLGVGKSHFGGGKRQKEYRDISQKQEFATLPNC